MRALRESASRGERHQARYPDLTRINYWASESECWRGTPDPVYL
jgi:hypothetical protein